MASFQISVVINGLTVCNFSNGLSVHAFPVILAFVEHK